MSDTQSVATATDVTVGERPQVVDHGEVFTRRWVVELILDLAGYTPERDLGAMRAVEPACGSGAFIVPMAERLLASLKLHGRVLEESRDALHGYDLIPANAAVSRRALRDLLKSLGEANADEISNGWVTCSDYLLDGVQRAPNFVIGNPPYVRQENVEPLKLAEYRSRYSTMVGRSDIYIGFFEKALRSLEPGGALAFICADRWMRNQYGRKLRALIGDEFSLDISIEMHNVDAFENQVSAYPAVTVISRRPQQRAAFVQAKGGFSERDVPGLGKWLKADDSVPNSPNYSACLLPYWFTGEDSWPTGSAARLNLVERLNDAFQPLENPDTGTRIGIGVATGADAVFVTKDPVAVEPSRLLPLAMSRDTVTGELTWSKRYLVNPWERTGELVELDSYPLLKDYFETHGAALLRRHVATKRPAAWFRTIDKVDHSLVDRRKLLFPDMKMTTHPVLDRGGLYPHHNLYYVVSRDWDLEVLGGLLLSKVAELFVDAYSVRMRGGTLRFQAQYLRKIRVPDPATISDEDAETLRKAFAVRDTQLATETACRLYSISGIPE